ncbi:DNA-protecting protein DprA [Oleiagrimonas citrea]|uniref:DNA-protecting protein DprA n=1 Tax=Oleiagrimonas citrea TaxID=1665687 RepID=A0A846ZQX7_9GAMM|nr:DNA-processing protein DprA [Oleiagrimonas citrea]NKZ39823.1 DNA-protecting protein DprA [Oleiagrimonas citrea]
MQEISVQTAWLTLLRAPGLGSKGVRALLALADGDVCRALERARCDGRALGLAPRTRDGLRRPDSARLEADAEWLARPHQRLLCCTDADFPPQLERMPDPPAALFVVGNADLLLRPQLAVVGARHAGPVGRRHAHDFAAALAQRGLVITSGLAEGIDAAAHRAALEVGGGTVAVVGTGPDLVYPRCHAALREAIAEQGAIVSEFSPGVKARPGHFPRRNRIIAGLALGTLVVEAGLRSGSLITARLAAECGREVYALPGSIHNPLARGCHRLIRDGARLVEDVEEICASLVPLARAQGADLAARLREEVPVGPEEPVAALQRDPVYADLLEALGHDPVTLDTLRERSGLSPPALSSMLLRLELDGVLVSQSGGRYQRVS